MIAPLLLLLACGSQADRDRDGFGVLDGDCDDRDATISPVAPEQCNGLDDDCDGEVDDAAAGGDWWYVDADGDGWGLSGYFVQHCGDFSGWSLERGDCDDGDPAVYPGAEERCDGLDQDCDGRADEGAADAAVWFADEDGDSWGNPERSWPACQQPAGWVAEGGDCDDQDPGVSPGAAEVCWTEADDDCDGEPNEQDAPGCDFWYEDADGDGDGEVEIVVGDEHGIFVVGDYDHGWVPGRQVWNQASYHIVNVEDDLSIPAAPEPNWPAHNNFRSGDVVPAFAAAAPDPLPLLVDLCTLECSEGILQLAVQIGNGGLGEVPAGLGVALYGDGALLATTTTSAPIASGGASEPFLFRIDVSGGPLAALTVVVDEADSLLECHEDNDALTITEGLCP